MLNCLVYAVLSSLKHHRGVVTRKDTKAFMPATYSMTFKSCLTDLNSLLESSPFRYTGVTNYRCTYSLRQSI